MGNISDLPVLDRPREKGRRYGLESLSDIELLAIILASGFRGSNAIEISASLYNKYSGLNNLSEVSIAELKKNKGIKNAKSIILAAVFEIHRRLVIKGNEMDDGQVNEEYLLNKYRNVLSRSNQENLILVLLNSKQQIIYETVLYRGSENMISLSFKDIYRVLLTNNAKSYYIIHNHVDGDSAPSEQDIIATNEIVLQCKRVNIKLVDHLIIGVSDYYSFRKMKKTNFSY